MKAKKPSTPIPEKNSKIQEQTVPLKNSMSPPDASELWRKEAYSKISDIMEKIYNHPFIQELLSGSLSEEIFTGYILQDIKYCKRYMKCLKSLSKRLKEKEEIEFFANASEKTENLCKYLGAEYNIKSEDKNEYISPCKDYSEKEEKFVNEGTLGEASGILFPCYLVQDYVGFYFNKRAPNLDGNKYKKFIEEMTIKDFGKSTMKYLMFIVKYSHEKKMHDDIMNTFVIEVQKEYEFWDGCYKHYSKKSDL